MVWFWYFLFYSFAGFLLEVAYARLTGGRPDRKCLLVLPLCPVYGLGACAVLLLPGWVRDNPLPLFLLGGGLASWAEYLAALFYEEALGVSFWDYSGMPGNVRGRICLPFSMIWGALALALVFVVHPVVAPLAQAIPIPVTASAMAALGSDILISCALMRKTGGRDCLKWYA